MEATYYKDTMRSYMIIPCPEVAETENYQYRMLAMNRIAGLLACEIRHIDGARYLYYDITGRQSVQSLYEGRRMSGTEFFHMIRELDRVSESISHYLLDEQHLILSQDQVFLDLQTGVYFFTYYPGQIQAPEIFRFLADCIDGTDKRAAAAAYRLSSVAGGSRQALRAAIREEAAEKEDAEAIHKSFTGMNSAMETSTGQIRYTRGGIARETEAAESFRASDQTQADWEEAANRDKGRKKRSSAKVSHNEMQAAENDLTEQGERKVFPAKIQIAIRILLILIALGGAGGLIAAQFVLYISHRERRLCIAGAILLVTAAGLMIAEMVMRIRRERRRKREEEKNVTPIYEKSDEENLPRFNRTDVDEYRLFGDENGNTVQLSEQETPGRLYGRERGNRIDLSTLPVTVGKAQSYVDVVLGDSSISRVHARIYKGEGGNIEIRDLDSTNGTWINGVRLMPNEKKVVHRGDEVRFGNVDYEYR